MATAIVCILVGMLEPVDAQEFMIDTSAGIRYKLSSEAGMLNLQLVVKDPVIQAKLLNAGMDVSFDIGGEQKPHQVVQFPESRVNELFSEGRPDLNPSTMRLIGLMKANNYTLKRFVKGSGSYARTESNNAGVIIDIQLNEKDELIYLLNVPIQSLMPKKTDSGFKISSVDVSIEINGIKPPMQSPTYEAQLPTGGRGGRTAGNAPPSTSSRNQGVRFGPAGPQGGFGKLGETSQTWTKIILQ
jgi:hypothetical protein